MSKPWWLSLLFLTIHVALVVSIDQAMNQVKVLREFRTISSSSANVKQCLWFAMQEYNEESKDDYVFFVSKILNAHLQITDRLEYLIHVEIARSDCTKPLNNNESCSIQEDLDLKKKMNCSFLIGALPWSGEFITLKKTCENA